MTPEQQKIAQSIMDSLHAAIDGMAKLTTSESAEPNIMEQFASFMRANGAVPSAAKTDTTIRASLPRAAGSRLGQSLGPAKVYVAKAGYDRALAKAQRAINGKVVQLVLAAGKKGISARDVAKRGNINPKSVQSAMYQLRHAGLIQSVDAPERA